MEGGHSWQRSSALKRSNLLWRTVYLPDIDVACSRVVCRLTREGVQAQCFEWNIVVDSQRKIAFVTRSNAMKRFCLCSLCSHLNGLTIFPLSGECSRAGPGRLKGGGIGNWVSDLQDTWYTSSKLFSVFVFDRDTQSVARRDTTNLAWFYINTTYYASAMRACAMFLLYVHKCGILSLAWNT